MSAVLFVQEEALTMLPGIQFTFLLIIIYSQVFGFKITFFIILVHVLLDNLFIGSFSVLTICPMLIAYTIIPLSLKFIKTNNVIKIAFLALLYSLIYCWLFIPFSVLYLDVDLIAYIKSDILFEVILAVFNFLAVLWFYQPLRKLLEEQYHHYLPDIK